jgi:transcriptional regulator with XRE-family HTH domain
MLETNPYAHLRKKSGYVQRRFCDDYEFAKQTIIMIEHGTYPELSDRMVRAIEEACYHAGIDPHHELEREYGVGDVQKAYEAWRTDQRARTATTVNEFIPDNGMDDVAPMAKFVKKTTGTVQGFAKLIKVPPATLLRYSRGEQDLMPSSIRHALIECGYIWIEELEKAQLVWKERRGELY